MRISLFDLCLEPFVGRIRLEGLALHPPAPGLRVLDVGCGTGTTLRLYRQAGCAVSGIDASPSMIAAARAKLGPGADLRLGDAAQMPYPNGSFDLVTASLALHEMPPEARKAVAAEMLRVLKPEGRAVLIDFSPWPPSTPLGWLTRALILAIEFLAGREHFRNGRQFVRAGSLPALFEGLGLVREEVRLAAAGCVGVYRFRRDQAGTSTGACR
jgi:ubiquinone/menaquinone biosynthesis C-methylase UbiE